MVGNELMIFGFPITSCLKDDKWRISIYINLLDSQVEGDLACYTRIIFCYILCAKEPQLDSYGNMGSFWLASFEIACRKGLLQLHFRSDLLHRQRILYLPIMRSFVFFFAYRKRNSFAREANLTKKIKLIVRHGMICRWSAIACPLPYNIRASGWHTQYRTLRVTSATLLYGPWGLAFQRETSAGPSLQSAWSYSSTCSGVGVARPM